MEYSKKASNCKLLLLDGYYTSQEAEIHLSERSTAVDGVGLKHVTDVVKIIDILKIVESNDDESDTAVDINLGGYCE